MIARIARFTPPSTTSSADSVGAQVTATLSEAMVTSANLLAQADRKSETVGAAELARLRESIEERIEALRGARERVTRLGEGTVAQLRSAASQLEDMPTRITIAAPDTASDGPGNGPLGPNPVDGPPPHLLALMKAADAIAKDLAEAAAKYARQVDVSARRDANRIVTEEPQRLGRLYDAAAGNAEAVRRDALALNKLLEGNKDVQGAPEVMERKHRWGRAR